MTDLSQNDSQAAPAPATTVAQETQAVKHTFLERLHLALHGAERDLEHVTIEVPVGLVKHFLEWLQTKGI